ncbi:response regulator transcription factor [Kribbella sp. NPDC058693]|uniref:Response regulator n=1 Tax=Kribbella jiaozuonensis TaxID=2575441 RepID=A0A4U3LW08_9ACTN|nr:response regulator transcription factor [Kribbella jiaozuonensis]TKK79484.1 response regulator [Kribbella jiaozuonensis]
MGAARFLIVDDHVLFRSSARRMLESQGFVVIGESGDGRSAITAVRTLRPDVVLLDVQLPDMNGFEVARQLAEEPDAPAVILTSIRDASDYRTRLTGTPARGFIPKAELSESRITALLARAP